MWVLLPLMCFYILIYFTLPFLEQGNFSSMPASAMTGPNFVYNPMNQSELTTSAPVNLSTKTISNTGESRDQPECKYFSSPGGCKYGSNCKFHHPKETMAYILGPHGFPLRPVNYYLYPTYSFETAS